MEDLNQGPPVFKSSVITHQAASLQTSNLTCVESKARHFKELGLSWYDCFWFQPLDKDISLQSNFLQVRKEAKLKFCFEVLIFDNRGTLSLDSRRKQIKARPNNELETCSKITETTHVSALNCSVFCLTVILIPLILLKLCFKFLNRTLILKAV